MTELHRDYIREVSSGEAAPASDRFVVGDWSVEPGRNCILRNGRQRRLEPRTMEVLVYLARRPEQTVSRDELLDAVWGAGTFVTENTLSRTVSRLRKALDDDWQNPTYLETISKSGYRLIAPVSRPPAVPTPRPVAEEEPTDMPAQPVPASRSYRPLFWAGLAVAAAATAFLAIRPGGADGPAGLMPSPVITLVGTQISSKLSPDGHRIAFSWAGPNGDNLDLYVKQVGSEDLLRLTSDPGGEGYPAWSADGNTIAYVRGGAEGTAIYEIAAIGGAPRLLGRVSPEARDLSRSGDGQRIVFSDIPEGATTRGIHELDPATGRTRALTRPHTASVSDNKPALSPDGSRVAFVRRGGRSDQVVLLSLEDGREAALFDRDGGEIRGVDWTGDGKRLIYSSNRDGQFALWSHPVDGGASQRLPIHDQWITEPSVARSSDRLIYRKFSDVVNIWSVELDESYHPIGSRKRQVPSTRTEYQPAISPDGSRLAFLSNRTGEFEVWSADLASGRLMRHTNLKGPVPGSPTWTPDGRSIVFDSAASGNGDLYQVAHDSTLPRRLTFEPSDEFNATFSPDGSWLYFTSNRTGQWQIWRMPATGGEAEQLNDNGGFFARQDAEGRFVVYVRPADGSIWRHSLADGTEHQLGSGHPWDWAAWDLVPGGALWVLRTPRSIAFFDFEKTGPRAVLEIEKAVPYMGPGISVTRDGRQLYFAEIEHSDDEIMLVDLAGQVGS